MNDIPYPASLSERIRGVEGTVEDHERRLNKLENADPSVLAERVRSMEKRLDRLVAATYAALTLIVALLSIVLGRGIG